MIDYIRNWFRRRFSDPNAVTLTLALLFGFGVIVFWGNILAPILIAVALAYLLEWPVTKLVQLGLHRLAAVLLVFVLFMALGVLLFIVLVPVVWQQSVTLLTELPQITKAWQELMEVLQERAPAFVEPTHIQSFSDQVNDRLLRFGNSLLEQSLSTIVVLATLLIYLIIVPLLVFFMLKDKVLLQEQIRRILPEQREMIRRVAGEMNLQIMNYIRGKVVEIVIVGVVTYVVLSLFDLRYAALLATLVGFSVLVPYIGAAVVTIPIALVGLFQFGTSMTLVWLIIAYLIIQALDGNLLVPLLFSEAVSLHPVYIITAVLVFGAIWGFWGVFFAIPLASLVKAVITAFAEQRQAQEAQQAGREEA